MERITKESLDEELNLKLQDAQKGLPTNLKIEKGGFIDQIAVIDKEIEDSDIIRKKDEEKLGTQKSIRGFYKELDASIYKAIDDSNRQLAKSLENRARRRNTLVKRKEKVERAQKNFILELKKRQEERNARIQEIDEKIKSIENSKKGNLEDQKYHEGAIREIKNTYKKLDPTVFTALDEAMRKHIDDVREAVKKQEEEIVELKQEKTGWEEDNTKLEDLINRINGVEKNIGQDEKEGKVAEETPATEAEKTEEVPEAPTSETEKPEEVPEAPVPETEKSKEVPETLAKQTEKPEKASVAPTQKKENGKENNNKTTANNPNNNKYVFNSGYGNPWVVDDKAPVSSTNSEEILDEHAPELKVLQEDVKNGQSADLNLGDLENIGKEDEAKEKLNALLKEIKVSISNEGKPVYSAIIVNGDKEEVITLDNDIYTKLNSAYVRHFEEVPELEKYLDPNIVELLMKVDKKYSTIEDTDKSTVEEIINGSQIKALKNYKELLIGKSEGKQPLIDISYDFSELYNIPADKDDKRIMKFIQKIAKANYNIGLLKSYEGRPSILERIKQKLSKVFARRITSETIDLDFKSSEINPSKEPSIREGKPTETPMEPTTETPVKANKQNDFKEGLKVPQQNLVNSNTTVMPENSENVAEVGNESSDHGEYGE